MQLPVQNEMHALLGHSKTIHHAALALEGVHHIQRCDRLATVVLSVHDRVADQVLQKQLQNFSGLLVDKTANALHATSAAQAADRGLGDTVNFSAHVATFWRSDALANLLAWSCAID